MGLHIAPSVRAPSNLPYARLQPHPHVQLNGNDNAYLKFHFVAGEDWQLLDGLEEGITQSSRVTQGEALEGFWCA